jgi:hypothetical protein
LSQPRAAEPPEGAGHGQAHHRQDHAGLGRGRRRAV